MKLYRGTQRTSPIGVKKALSYTPSLPVAVIYSARPGDVWGRKPARFTANSTVHVAKLVPGAKVVELCSHANYCSFQHVLDVLQYKEPDGLTWDEAGDVLTYLHKRLIGRQLGGEFSYKIFDEDGDEMEDFNLPFSIQDPYTPIRTFQEDFEYDDEIGEQLVADAYIFADAPRFKIVAQRLGYDVVAYQDVFAGGVDAAEELLHCGIYDMDGVDEEQDLSDEFVPVHMTYRPLHDGAITIVKALPVTQVLPEVSCALPDTTALKARLLR
jgi:hypothetical protein